MTALDQRGNAQIKWQVPWALGSPVFTSGQGHAYVVRTESGAATLAWATVLGDSGNLRTSIRWAGRIVPKGVAEMSPGSFVLYDDRNAAFYSLSNDRLVSRAIGSLPVGLRSALQSAAEATYGPRVNRRVYAPRIPLELLGQVDTNRLLASGVTELRPGRRTLFLVDFGARQLRVARWTGPDSSLGSHEPIAVRACGGNIFVLTPSGVLSVSLFRERWAT